MIIPWAVGCGFLPIVISNLYCKENKSEVFPGVWWAWCWCVPTGICDNDCICCSTLDVAVILHHPRQGDMAATLLTSQEINVLIENIELSCFQVLGCPKSTEGLQCLKYCHPLSLCMTGHCSQLTKNMYWYLLWPSFLSVDFPPHVPIFCGLLSTTKAGAKIYYSIFSSSRDLLGNDELWVLQARSWPGSPKAVPDMACRRHVWGVKAGSIHQSGSLLSVPHPNRWFRWVQREWVTA